MIDVLPNLKRALLVLHSPVDEVVGIDNAAQIYKAARHPKSFIDRIKRQIEVLGPLDANQRQRLMEIADRCPVHRTLQRKIEVVTEEKPPAEDATA